MACSELALARTGAFDAALPGSSFTRDEAESVDGYAFVPIITPDATWITVFDGEGEVVWALPYTEGVIWRLRPSRDGTGILFNVPTADPNAEGRLMRVDYTGHISEVLHAQGLHADFVEMENGTMAFLAKVLEVMSWEGTFEPLPGQRPHGQGRRSGPGRRPREDGENIHLMGTTAVRVREGEPWPVAEYPLELNQRELELGRVKMIRNALAKSLYTPRSRAWERDAWPPRRLHKFDAITFRQYLVEHGRSDDVFRLATLGWAHPDEDGGSALAMFLRALSERTGHHRVTIADGMDQLPRAFADALGERVKFEQIVEAVDDRGDRVVLSVREGATTRTLEAARVVFTVPIPVMARVELRSGLSPAKAAAFRELTTTSASRAVLPVRESIGWPIRSPHGLGALAKTLSACGDKSDDTDTSGVNTGDGGGDGGTFQADGDGYGDPASATVACEAVEGEVDDDDDRAPVIDVQVAGNTSEGDASPSDMGACGGPDGTSWWWAARRETRLAGRPWASSVCCEWGIPSRTRRSRWEGRVSGRCEGRSGQSALRSDPGVPPRSAAS